MTVLVGYVPTAQGEAAFTAALAEAQRRGEELMVLNSPREGATVSAVLADGPVVEDLVARAARSGVRARIRQEAYTGELADRVVGVAREIDASLIVIGLRHRSPVGKLIMGSTAQRILLEADRPVLAVKA